MIRRLVCLSISVAALLPGAAASAQPVENTPSLCQNQQDDDGDGLVDCADDGCSRLIFCVDYQPEETGAEACGNGTDDDGDGAADCDDDGCAETCGATPTVREGQPGTRGIYQPRVIERGPDVGYLEHDDPRDYPFAYAERPMTYLEGMLVPQASLSLFNLGGLLGGLGGSTVDLLSQLAFGASYGILDELELSVVPVSMRLTPGDAEYGSPAIAMTLRFFSEEMIELGIYGNVVLPLTTASSGGSVSLLTGVPNATLAGRARLTDFTQLDAALNMRLRFADLVRIDLTLPMVNVLFTEDAMGELSPEAFLWFDLKVGFSITDYAYAGLYSGVVISSTNSFESALIPLGFFVGGVIPGPSRRGPLADIGIRFGWPFFANTDPGGGDAVNADAWALTFDVRFFTFLLP